MKSAIRITYACLGVVFVSGCMQARIEESRELATPIAKGERVVILAKPQIEGAGAEDDFMDCVSDGLAGGHHGIAVHDNNEFVDKMFPWFEPSTAPGKPEAMSALLARPGVAGTGHRERRALCSLARRQHPQDRRRRQPGLRRGARRRGLHRLRLVAKGIRLRGHHLGFETGQVRG